MFLGPASNSGTLGYFYRINRKIRFLRRRGTLFHKKPKKNHLKTDSTFPGNGIFLIILLNSTFIFLLAYFFVFLVKGMTIMIAAGSFDINSVLMYYDVDFLIRGRDWSADAVKVVFSTGPFISLLLSIIAIILFALSSYKKWTILIFMIWVFLHAFTLAFGDIIFGTILNQGFGWVLAYLYFEDTGKMLLVVGMLSGMMLCGLFISRFLLLTGNIYFNYITNINRKKFLFAQIILPYFFGTGIIILIKQPLMNAFEVVVEVSMILILIPALLQAYKSNDLFFDEDPRKIKIRWDWILLTCTAILLFRIFFWTGIRL
jgi:hypothetical protein